MSGWEIGDPPDGSALEAKDGALTFATIELPKPKPLVFRGREIKVSTDMHPNQQVLVASILALLNLEDPRVDAVVRAFDIKLFDADGVKVWPPEEGG